MFNKSLLSAKRYCAMLVLAVCVFFFPALHSATAQEDMSENGDRMWLRGGINFLAADSTTMITLRLRMQNQASLETVSASNLAINDAQFLIRRVRLRLNGFVVDPRLTFLLQLGFTRGDADFDNTQFFNVLRDAMITYRVQPNFHLSFGLGKLPGNRERVISSGEQQFIDRSIVNRTFTLDRDVGFQAYYSHTFGAHLTNDPRVSLRLALTTGEGRNPLRALSGLMYTARLSIFPFGSFTNNGDYFVSDLAFEQTPKLYLAAVVSRNENATRTGGTIGLPLYTQRTMENYFIDGIFKYRGFSLYGEYSRRLTQDPVTRDGANIRAAFAGEGLDLQAGYIFIENWEAALRYSAIEPNADMKTFLQGQTQYTLCLTRFFNGHRVKAQTDVTYNVLRSNASEQASWIVRFQVELGL
jgi:phosphate-selective porin OprO/OprP